MNGHLKPTFIVERCKDCHTHSWNTRHDEKKYESYGNAVAQAIRGKIPALGNDQVLVNQFNYDLAQGGIVQL